MSPKKQVKLTDWVGKLVVVKDKYKDNSEGPFKLLGVDAGFVCLELKGEAFWWSLKDLEGFSLLKEEETDGDT